HNNVTPPDTYSVQAPSGGVTDWYQEPSTGTPAGRVILFGTIPTTIPDTTPLIAPPTTDAPTIPPSPDYTPASPDYSPASEAESDPSQRSLVIPRCRVMIQSSRQPIPHGRPYRYHLNGPIHMMTARKRVRPLPVQQLSVRHPVDHSSSDSSSRHSSSDHSSPDLPSTSAGPSRKRRRSPMTSVPALPLVSGALSLVRADLIPSPKRVKDIGYLADVKDDPRETRVERVMLPVMPKDIPEPAQEGAAEVTYKTLGDLVQRFQDHTQAIPVHRIQTTEGIQREQGRRIVEVESAIIALTERVAELERVTRGLEALRVLRVREKMPNTRSRASMTHEEIEELIAHRVAEEMEAREVARNLVALNENEEEQEDENGGNENGGNRGNGNGDNGGNENGGNGNEGNGNHGMNYGGFVPMDRDALTWWNSHKRTIGVDAAYAMKWAELMKLMTEVYCPRNEVQKMETELWNLTVKGNDLTAYIQRFQELILLCTRMVPDEEDRLMDKKLQGYAARSAENKRMMESNPRDYRGQQPLFKSKCKLHHEWLCTIRCGNCKRVGHQTRDCRATVNPNTQGAVVGNPHGIVCYGCGRTGHFRKDCPKLRNQNRGNQTRNKTGNKTGGNEVTIRAYAIGGGGTNPDSNVVTEKYVKKGFPIFLAHITTKEVEDKSKERRLEDVPVVRDFS
nr:hypothetical protein [Tanacetum cinerariifolium]